MPRLLDSGFEVRALARTPEKLAGVPWRDRIEVAKGSNVAQGQRIGAVGATGWATGPHLHFEFRVKGQHQDPLTLARQSDTLRLDPVSRQDFLAAAQRTQVKLDIAESLAGSRVASFE